MSRAKNTVLKHRRLIARSLVRAITFVGAKDETVARWIGVELRTLKSWLRAETAMRVEKVFACEQLHDAFRAALCSHEHESLEVITKSGRK